MYRLVTVTTALIFLSRHVLAAPTAAPFKPYDSTFLSILGSSPSIETVINATGISLREGAVFHPPTNSLFVTSDTVNGTAQYIIHVTDLNTGSPQYEILTDLATVLPNPAGGVRYLYNGTDSVDLIAFACAGTLTKPGGIFTFDPNNPVASTVRPITTSYGAYRYNSPDDLTALSNGDIYFTDPVYGSYHNYTPAPFLPNQVYVYNATTNTTRVAADGFGRPNGVTHSPDEKTIYIGDTGASVGDGTVDKTGSRTTYALDIVDISGQSFLTNRRVFAMPYVGGYDGLKTDTMGRIWGFADDGAGDAFVDVWSPGGKLLGNVKLKGESGDLGFGNAGEVYAMTGKSIQKIVFAKNVTGTGVISSYYRNY